MSAPLHRAVDMLTGEVSRPSRFFEANAKADDRLAELEQLRAENAALKGAMPEWEVMARNLNHLISHYQHNAKFDDAALSNLSELTWLQSQVTTEMFRELHHWASAADEADTARREAEEALEELRQTQVGEVQAHNNELFHENGQMRRHIQRLETALAETVSERDTARVVGGSHV